MRTLTTPKGLLIFLIVAVLGSGLVCTGTAMAKDKNLPLSVRHAPSGLNTKFDFKDGSFEQYIAYEREIIGRARFDLDDSTRNRVIDANAPFSLTPESGCDKGKNKAYRRGIVLTHGLTDSPYFMRPLAEFFRQGCFRVMGVLLPGHGTRPGDLLNVTWQEWLKAVKFGVASMATEADEVYLGGFSTGGTLSIEIASEDRRIRGLMLFSPALKVSPMAMMANWNEAFNWVAPRSRWVDVLPDEDPYKYESFPANAADQIHLLSTKVRQEFQTRKLMIPVFIAASEEDATVHTPSTLEFLGNAIHPRNIALIYTSRLPVGKGESNGKIEYVGAAAVDRRILSSAHTAIVLPSGDSHYGDKGDYSNCMHYFVSKPQTYSACKTGSYDYLGEVTEENLKKGAIRRLMFNPQFDDLKERLRTFLTSLPSD